MARRGGTRGTAGKVGRSLAALAIACVAAACAGPAGPAEVKPPAAANGPSLAAPAVAARATPPATRSLAERRWQHVLADYQRQDLDRPPRVGGTVFIGSSSISHWQDLPASFPDRYVVGRGLGGARLADCTELLDRLVLPHRPRTVVVYAGDNDLAEGLSPEAVLADYRRLVDRLEAALPGVRIVYLSIKPSPLRRALSPQVREANARIAAYARARAGLDFVDVHTPMLDAAGEARAGLFDADGLHLNAGGYALWRTVLDTHLDRG